MSQLADITAFMAQKTIVKALAGGLEGWAVDFWGGRDEARGAFAQETDKRRHVWLCIGAQLSMRPERLVDLADTAIWRARFQSDTSASLLRQAGLGEAQGLIGCLGKLGWTGLKDPTQYLKLADILADGGVGAATLCHRKRIGGRTIDILHALPMDLRKHAVLKALKASERHGSPQRAVSRWVWRLERLREIAPKLEGKIRRRLAASGGDLSELWSDLPLPPPPWSGSATLYPLETPHALRNAAKRFENCLADQSEVVRRGFSYFYELEGRAVVELEQTPGLGWEVGNICGRRNQAPTLEVLQDIERILGNAPAHISPHLPSSAYPKARS